MNAKETILKTAADLGITMEVKFIPLSESRNSAEKTPSLNWKVSLIKNGKAFLTTEYSAGCGHAPSYLQRGATLHDKHAVDLECETGKSGKTRAPIMPDLADVLHSLASDASAIDFSSFEEWAMDCGYDSDSRKAEAIYRACLEIALKLRNALGDAELKTLRNAAQDY